MSLFAKKMRRFIDKPFKKGGTGPGSFDCLGLVAAVQDSMGRTVPRSFEGWSETDYYTLYEKDREAAEETMMAYFDSFAAPQDAGHLLAGDIVVLRSAKNGWRFPAVYVGNNNCITSLADLGTRVFQLAPGITVVRAWRAP